MDVPNSQASYTCPSVDTPNSQALSTRPSVESTAAAPTTTPKPSYAEVLKTQAEDNTNLMPYAHQYLQDDEQAALAIEGTREDELPG